MERVKSTFGELPVNYGMNAMALFSEMRGMSMTDTVNLDAGRLGLTDYLTLLYVGLKDGARKAKEEFVFGSFEDFCDYADEHTEIVGDVASIFAGQQKEKEEKGEPVKKK